MDKLLEIKNLKIIFNSAHGVIKAVEGIDLNIAKGETCALVGESGCGKSVTSHAIMRLLNTPPAVFTADKMYYYGKDGNSPIDLAKLSESEMLSVRGNEISMIFQDPSSSLNPVITVGRQIDEIFIHHKKMGKKEAREATVALLKAIGVPSPEKRYSQFPHEMSGGMKQRVLIAMATACKPKLMIADEPTTALDVTIQAQILDLMKSLQQESGMSLLLITHDLGVVAHMAEKVYVMYLGKIMEYGKTSDLLKDPLHPYTRGLINAVPSLDGSGRLEQIPGSVPHPSQKPKGCFFSSRCNKCMGICKEYMPPLREIGGRQVRCWLYGGVK